MIDMNSIEEPEATSSTHFIPRRRPPHSSLSQTNRSTSRPHSIGASIISNPKLVKGWQYYDNSPSPLPKDIQKYFSTINLGTASSSSIVAAEHSICSEHGSSERGDGGTGEKNGEDCSSYIFQMTVHPTVYGETTTTTAAGEEGSGLIGGGEIKACVAKEEPSSKCWSPILGILLTIVGSTCLALSVVFKESVPRYEYHPYSVLLVWSSQGLLWPSFVLLLCPCQMRSVTLTKKDIPWNNWFNNKWVTILLLLLRAIFGWTAAILSLESLTYISEGHSTRIQWAFPVFVIFLAWPLLHEKPGLAPIVAALVIIFVGVVTITQEGDAEVNVWGKQFITGCLFAGIAMILEGVFSVLILRHVRHVHFALVSFVYGLVGIVSSLYLYFVENAKFQIPESSGDIGLAAVICVLTFLGEVGVTAAVKYEQAGLFSVVRSWQVPMMVLWRWKYLAMDLDGSSFIGALVIFLGIFALAVRKLVESRPNSRRTRKWLRLLLI